MAGPFGAEHRNQNQTNFVNFYVATNPEREVSSLSRGGWNFVMNDDKVVWHLQQNKVAHTEYLYHTVVWRDDDAETDEEWRPNGTGKGSGFVASLERGDRIVVWARAMVIFSHPSRNPRGTNYLQFAFWENNVSEVVVDVYYSV
jgi:hypothetical protein